MYEFSLWTGRWVGPKSEVGQEGEGAATADWPAPPTKSPSAGRRRSQLEQRKCFLIPEAATHGRRGRRPPPAPRGCPVGDREARLGRFPRPGDLSEVFLLLGSLRP